MGLGLRERGGTVEAAVKAIYSKVATPVPTSRDASFICSQCFDCLIVIFPYLVGFFLLLIRRTECKTISVLYSVQNTDTMQSEFGKSVGVTCS